MHYCLGDHIFDTNPGIIADPSKLYKHSTSLSPPKPPDLNVAFVVIKALVQAEKVHASVKEDECSLMVFYVRRYHLLK